MTEMIDSTNKDIKTAIKTISHIFQKVEKRLSILIIWIQEIKKKN